MLRILVGFGLAAEPSCNIFDAGIARAEDVQKLDRSRAVRNRILDDSRNERWREAQLDELGFLLVPQRPRLAGGSDDDVPRMQGALVDAPGALLHEIDGAAQEHRDGVCGVLLDEIDVADTVVLDHDAVPLPPLARQERFGHGAGHTDEDRGWRLQQRSHDFLLKLRQRF